MNCPFLYHLRLKLVGLFILTGFYTSYGQSDSAGNSGICKQLAIQGAQLADLAYNYTQKNYFEIHTDIIVQNIDTALTYIKQSISCLDSAIMLASDSSRLAIEHANMSRDFDIDTYNTLVQLKKSDFRGKKELSKKAAYFAANSTVEAYHASFYFTDQKKPEKETVSPDTVVKEKQVTKLDIDQTLFTLLKTDINEKAEVNKQEIAKLKAELEHTKSDEKIAIIKGQLRILEAKTKEYEKKGADAEQKLNSINALIAERDKAAATTTTAITNVQKDTIFSKSTVKTAEEWNEQIKSDSEIPGSLVYQVQLGVFKSNVVSETFKGLTPIYSKTTDKGVVYTTGLFEKLSDAKEAKDAVQAMGLKDAFIVAYYNKKQITLAEAAKLEKK